MKAEFEEKTYENLMNIAFACEFNAINIFAPGQILENDLGFDVMMNIKNQKFFRKFFYLKKRRRFFLHINYKNLKTKNNKLEQILKDSKVNFNIFIQYKRSDYFTCRSRKGKCCSQWQRPYYGYRLYINTNNKEKSQHELLLNLYNEILNKALVVYAAPAFHTLKELFKYMNNYRELIKNSNFCDVGKLNNHRYVSFINGGTYNIACSKPEKIETLNIEKEIVKLKKHKYEDLNILYFRIKFIADIIDKIMKSKKDEQINPIKQQYQDFVEKTHLKEFEILNIIYKIQLFQLLTNTNILWNIEYELNSWDRRIRKSPILKI